MAKNVSLDVLWPITNTAWMIFFRLAKDLRMKAQLAGQLVRFTAVAARVTQRAGRLLADGLDLA